MKNQKSLCEKLLTIVSSIADGVITVDLDWRITFINKAAQRITGFKDIEAMGKVCREVFQTNVCDVNCPLKRTFTTGTPVINQPVCLTNKSGQRIPVSISTALLKDEKGRIIGGVETFRDLDLARKLHNDFEVKFTHEGMISRNKVMQELFEILPTIAESGSPVLIEGESGPGRSWWREPCII
ncbi:MAG: PAS domain-containing protein [Candidatus Zixiibacteriota bacterium]